VYSTYRIEFGGKKPVAADGAGSNVITIQKDAREGGTKISIKRY